MNRISGLLTVLAGCAAAAAGAQTNEDVNQPVKPDTVKTELQQPQARRYMNDFARCLAKGDKRRAKAALLLPYMSEEQSTAANKILPTGGDGYCFGRMLPGRIELGFQVDSLVAGMAEYFVVKQFDPALFSSLTKEQLAAPDRAPRNPLEEFAQCVVAQEPAASFAVVKTDPTTSAERQAFNAVAPALSNCIIEGKTVALDTAAVRRLLAIGLYRLMGAARGS